jgi:hypothetical protein
VRAFAVGLAEVKVRMRGEMTQMREMLAEARKHVILRIPYTCQQAALS